MTAPIERRISALETKAAPGDGLIIFLTFAESDIARIALLDGSKEWHRGPEEIWAEFKARVSKSVADARGIVVLRCYSAGEEAAGE
jgi:hypothetical protein